MDHAETVAKRVLERILPGTMEYQVVQSHGEIDFELRYHNRRTTAAVEVTASVDQTQAQTMAAIRDEKKGGSSIPATKCEKSWVIFPAKNARIDKIRASADGYLSRLGGIEKFFWVRDGHRQGVHEICHDLSVISGWVIPTHESPTIRIACPIGGGAVGPSLAIEAGEREAWKPDNRKKLGAAKTGEHHLVVHIDALNGLPWVALTDFEPPPVLPNLPEEVSDLWLVGQKQEANEFVVWNASTTKHWSSLRLS